MLIRKPKENVNSIIFGALLGDAYCSTKGAIYFAGKNKEYIDWLYYQLSDYCTDNPPRKREPFDKRTQKTYTHYAFNTRALFIEFREMFYVFNEELKKEVKIVPKDFKDFLDPTVLAIWYMDDGGRISNTRNGVFITLDAFTSEEALQIKEGVDYVFELETKIHRAGKSKSGRLQHRLAVPSRNYDLFHQAVYPIISQVPSMHDKKLPDVWIRKSH